MVETSQGMVPSLGSSSFLYYLTCFVRSFVFLHQLYMYRCLYRGSNAACCSVEFETIQGVRKAMELNGTPIPYSNAIFCLHWHLANCLDYSIFVGNLEPGVDSPMLSTIFRAGFPSHKGARIIVDYQTGQSKGYGFVHFYDERDQQKALLHMQGVYCGNRPMYVAPAAYNNRFVFPCLSC